MQSEEKFQFDQDFQENLLHYTTSDKNGHRALQLYEDTYFGLIEHQIIAKALKNYFKRKKKIPQSKAVLREQLRQMYMTKDFITALTAEDKNRITKIVNKMYKGNVKDGDDILDATVKFAQYIKLKDTVEQVNLTDFGKYDIFADRVRKAITIGNEFKEQKGILLVKGIKDRQYQRKMNEDIIPTPFHQVNRLTNGGGFTKGTVIVLIGPEKEFKTGFLINVARKYLGSRKRVLYIDLENGQKALSLRLEQSIMRKTKLEIMSGEFDDKVLKQFRKYARLKAEVDIKRFPAYTTTCTNIQAYIDDQYREEGIRYTDIVIDYGALLGAISGNKDDTARISDAYIDIKNLTEYNQFDTCWTANHIVRTADIRFATQFRSSDTAKCIDIVRHVDVAFGYNRNDMDIQAGNARLEIIDQRDGVSKGAAVFKVDYPKQRADEMTRQEIKDYWDLSKQREPETRKKGGDLRD